MRPTVRGRDALARYLSKDWTFDQLYDWVITFWDGPVEPSDEESSEIAGDVLTMIWELGKAVPTMDAFNAEVTSLASKPREIITHQS